MHTLLLLMANSLALANNVPYPGCLANRRWCDNLQRCIMPGEVVCGDENNSYGPPIVIKDEFGCYKSSGYQWCPFFRSCIRPWETECPVEPTIVNPIGPPIVPGSDSDPHGCVPSANNVWCPRLNRCILASRCM